MMRERPVDMAAIGRNIRGLRHWRQWTQAELARRADCSVATVSALERGKAGISLEMLLRLCRALQCTSAELLGGQ